MTELFPLDLFPEGGLTSSVVVTVWIGIWVVSFLNLRFGFALSGLVVPGYLVPLLLVKPISAGIILLEGLITYFITLALAGSFMRRLGASEMFGRDRFFALVLVSIVVRVCFDGWLLPTIGLMLNEAGVEFDHRNNLQSFGLIIISLIANQMWNGGARRGCISLFTYLAGTFLIVKFLILPLTNYSISNLSFIYEDMASSILATPKAYIILLTTAYIASKMNLRYGWEFNGILIPSLLALQWYEPSKLLVTFVEAFVILWLGKLCLNLPFFARLNMEGSRLLLLFFNISFIYKYLLSVVLIRWAPELKVSDYFAFGYLLSTLLALKMFQKDIPILITRATLQTSAVALVIASVFGFALSFLQSSSNRLSESGQLSYQDQDIAESLEAFVVEKYSLFYRSRTEQFSPPTLTDMAIYEQALGTLGQLLRNSSGELSSEHPSLKKVQKQLQEIEIDLRFVTPHFLVLSDKVPARAGGMVVLNLSRPQGLTIEVPAPLNETGIADLALRMFIQQQAKALIYAGSLRQQDPQRRSDMLSTPRSFFQIAHEQLGERNILQLRAYTRKSARELFGQRFSEEFIADRNLPNLLWIKNSLPADLELLPLQNHLSDFDLSWRTPVFVNRQRDYSREGFAELMLSRAGIRQLISALTPLAEPISESDQQASVQSLSNMLAISKQNWAEKGSQRYQPARLDELIFFDEQVLTPLLGLLEEQAQTPVSQLLQEQQRIDRMAGAFGYKLLWYTQPGTLQRFLVLQEQESANRRYWGTYVFRLGPAVNYVIEVPRPQVEVSSLDFAVQLFEQLKARALLVPSSHAWANADGSADVLGSENTTTLFNLVHLSLLRHFSHELAMVLQVRGLSAAASQAGTGVDVRLARWQNSSDGATSPQFLQLTRQLQENGLSVDMVDGAASEVGYEAHYGVLSRYLPVTENAEMTTLWVSQDLRRRIITRPDQQPYAKQFQALQVPFYERELPAWLLALPISQHTLPRDLKQKLAHFIATGDIVLLANILDSLSGLQLETVLDHESQQYFILLTDPQHAFVAMANLSPLKPEEVFKLNDTSALDSFLTRRSGWLLGGQK